MPKPVPWKMTSQYRRIVFTVNLADDQTWENFNLNKIINKLPATSFMIAGKETGEGGRKHFQGYAEFKKKVQGKTIDTAFRTVFPLPISCHYEAVMGTAAQNIEYCSKEDKNPFKYGEVKQTHQGERSDLDVAMNAVADGIPMVQIAETMPSAWAQYRRALNEYAVMKAKKRNWVTRSIYLWGPTGTGKTMHAQELEPTTVYWTGSFLNGYSGTEKVLLFDDFDYKKMDWQTFLTITDRYPMTINIKGGWANFAPEIIIFTSNSNPKDWYSDVPLHTLEAIHRRMDEYGEIRNLGAFVPKEQNILTKYLIKEAPKALPPPAPAGAASGGVPALTPPGTPEQDIVVIESDEEEEPPSIMRAKTIYHYSNGDTFEVSDDE